MAYDKLGLTKKYDSNSLGLAWLGDNKVKTHLVVQLAQNYPIFDEDSFFVRLRTYEW